MGKIGLRAYKKLSLPQRAALWYTMGMIIQRLPHLVLVPLLTHLVTQAQYGMITVYQAWLSIFWIVAVLGVREGVTVGISEFESARDSFVSSVMFLATLIVAGFTVLFMVFSETASWLLGMPPALVLAMLLDVWAFNISEIWLKKQRYQYNYKSALAFCGISALMQICIPVAAIITFSAQYAVYAKIFSSALCAAMAAALLFIASLKKGKQIVSTKFWKYSLALGLPLIANAVSNAVLNASDRLMISAFCGEDRAALYSVPYQVAWAFLIIINAINAAFIPFQYEHFKAGNFLAPRKPATLLLLFWLALLCAVSLIAPEILQIMAPSDYQQAVYVFPPVLSALFFQFLYLLMSNVEYYFKAVWKIAVATVSAALLNIGLNYLFIPVFGYIAAAYTTLFSYIMLAMFHAVNMRSVCRGKGISLNFYDGRMFILLSALSIILPLLTSLMFEYMLIRLFLVVILAVTVVVLLKRSGMRK